ncbi:MAG: hypothetical protein IJA34_09965 [Lachnospiraceae bacterium]|nr:hypothetical protein [Lachnospiraceae bacterium]
MKNAKKLVALAAAATMLMSSATVYADTIEGDVNFVNTTIYKVTLPTTEGMSFLLDPQGLTSLDAGSYDANEAGKIVSEGEMVAVNESSVDVVLNADFYLVDSDTESPVDVVASDGTLTTDSGSGKQTSKEVQIYITTDDDTTDTVEVGEAAGAGTNFTMDAATYTFGGNKTDGYTYDLTADSGSKLKMEIEGTVAKDYDWSAYADGTQTLTLNAVFKFTKTAGGDAVVNTEASTPTPTDNYVMSLNEDGTVSYTFVDAPEGTLTAFTLNGTARNGQIGSNVTYAEGTLTIARALTETTTAGWWNASSDNTIVVTIGSEAPITLTYSPS